MIVAFWCVLVAGILPLACSYVAKGSAARTSGDRFDNGAPREWLARRTGLSARANAAQQNGWEAFPFFAAAVIIAVLQHVPVATIDVLAVVFVAARVAFIACYLGDRPSLRSLSWLVGFLACIGLFVAAATGTLR